MRHNIVLAGVGGQGILTIARGLSAAALARGLRVKQAEVHGMSQRGGAVYSHLRISDSEIYSDLIPAGQADMILAVEPLEALRYAPMLKEDGVIVSSTNAIANIATYPPIEQVLSHIAAFPGHIAIDMEKLARAAGSTLSANIVALGAASHFLGFSMDELEQAVTYLFESKGDRVVETNLRALRFGRNASGGYLEGLQRGATPQSVRQWIETLAAEDLEDESFDLSDAEWIEDVGRLSGAEAHAFESILTDAYEEGRKQLYEHEVYSLIELVGAISPPRHAFVPKGSMVPRDMLESFPGERVVIKLVSPDVVHKTEASAVLFVPKDTDAVREAIDSLIARHSAASHVEGVLVVEFVEHEFRGLGSELFVGIRSTREFGPVIAAGLGGLDTEFLAAKMRPGVAVAKALATDIDAEEFLELFKDTAAYDLLSGRVRGHDRVVADGDLLRCFRAFISIAKRFCIDRGEEGPDIGELEVNPFAYRGQKLVPLDGRGALRTAARANQPRPMERIAAMLEPRTIALAGVSSKEGSLGRIILENIRRRGFDPKKLWIVKEGSSELDGVPCVSRLADLPGPVDLLVVSAPATALPSLVREATTSQKVGAGILISGGAGESEGSESIGEEVRLALREARSVANGPVFLGPNCMGVRSVSGQYDTFFIPEEKLDAHVGAEAQPVALISQSGAFVVSRLSDLRHLNPAFSISLGNQADITVSDLLLALLPREDIRVAGVYVEGFSNLDGLETARAVSAWTNAGKTVVFYKGGRTESGRTAAAGHTMAVAGDYEICLTAMRHAGALVAEDFRDFAQLVETSTLLHSRQVRGGRIFAMTNAGMEAVGVADVLPACTDEVGLAALSDRLIADLRIALEGFKLGSLVSPRNPLDLTPMAGEGAYAAVADLALLADEVDALIVSCVPLAPQLKTSPDQLSASDAFPALTAGWASRSVKPVVFVVDSGRDFDAMADEVRARGIPVFRSADEAARVLAAWMAHRLSVASATASVAVSA